MNGMRKIIEISEELCNGCGNCIVSCAEGALQIVDGKAELVSDRYCDGLGACLGECPTGALRIIERRAADFDEKAVEHYLSERDREQESVSDTLPCGCPSTHIQTFATKSACQKANEPVSHVGIESELTHWPVQIRLVPSNAGFLKHAHLLVIADCTAIAYPNFHRDFLQGKVVLVGCPKFDDTREYVEKFTDIFLKADIRSITTLVMEVPCCQGLPVMVKTAMDNAGKSIPLEYVVIGVRGHILKREDLVA
jgi:Pyruvate/2-oxoacid:ferredoxin oxidoreductase delta subunit